MILPGNLTKTLPHIIYNEVEGFIHIHGKSISSEVREYFAEFLTYLKDCIMKNPLDMHIIVDLEYYNTTTAKILVDFFTLIKTHIVKKGFNVNIEWIYEEGDEDNKESGEDYESLLNMGIKVVKKSE